MAFAFAYVLADSVSVDPTLVPTLHVWKLCNLIAGHAPCVSEIRRTEVN